MIFQFLLGFIYLILDKIFAFVKRNPIMSLLLLFISWVNLLPIPQPTSLLTIDI